MPLSYWSKTVKQNDCSSNVYWFFESAYCYLVKKMFVYWQTFALCDRLADDYLRDRDWLMIIMLYDTPCRYQIMMRNFNSTDQEHNNY